MTGSAKLIRAAHLCFLSSTVLVAAFSWDAHARECDPAKILILDSYNSVSDRQSSLSQASTKSEDTSNKQGSSASFDFIDIFKVSGGETDDFSKALRETFKLDIAQRQRRWETYTWLSDNARDAFVECLKAQDESIFIFPSDNAMTSENISIEVRLRPFVVSTSIPADFDTGDTATITDKKLPKTMVPGGKVIVSVKRDLKKAMTFKATIGGSSAQISLPPRQDFKFQQEVRYSGTTTYGHPTNDSHDTHEICVTLAGDDEAVIIPNSGRFVRQIDIEDGIDATVVPKKGAPYNPRQVCLQGGQTVGKNGANLRLCGYAIAQVLAKVPIGATSSGKGDAPAFVSNASLCK
jgi:hypothetical protein